MVSWEGVSSRNISIKIEVHLLVNIHGESHRCHGLSGQKADRKSFEHDEIEAHGFEAGGNSVGDSPNVVGYIDTAEAQMIRSYKRKAGS